MPIKLENLTSYHRGKTLNKIAEYWKEHWAEIRKLTKIPTQIKIHMVPEIVTPIEPEGAVLFDCSRWDGHNWVWYFNKYILKINRSGNDR